MKVDFIELTNFRGIQKQRIRFKNKNFVALIGDNGSGKTTILEGITKGFVPVLRTINAEAMKECDLANKDIRNGANGTTVTLGITLDGEKYVWTNRRRLSSQQPFENNGDVKVKEEGSYKGWSIEAIQEHKMGVEPKTAMFNQYLEEFSSAMDDENYEKAKTLYKELKEMVSPGSHESKILKLDMEMIEADDKA